MSTTSFECEGDKSRKKEEEKAKLMKEIRPRFGTTFTLEESISNTKKVQEFNNKWKDKNEGKSLQNALYEIYIQRKFEEIEEEGEDEDLIN